VWFFISFIIVLVYDCDGCHKPLVALIKAFSPISTMLSMHDVFVHDSCQVQRLRGGICIGANVMAPYVLCRAWRILGKKIKVA
jgi:hypothetical protein